MTTGHAIPAIVDGAKKMVRKIEPVESARRDRLAIAAVILVVSVAAFWITGEGVILGLSIGACCAGSYLVIDHNNRANGLYGPQPAPPGDTRRLLLILIAVAALYLGLLLAVFVT